MTNDTAAPGPAPSRTPGREARVVRKRFYVTVATAPLTGGFTVQLDGRGVRTPRKRPLLVSSQPLADAIATEWQAQTTEILPTTMPLTTLACTAIDAVADQMAEVGAEIGRYASSDLLCYRADAPPALASQQASAWDPLIDWAATTFAVPFQVTTGLMPVAQAPAVATAVATALAPLDPFRLAAAHVLTTLTGSAVLALAVLHRRLTLPAAWTLAHMDEDWQIERWGTDAEAEARRAARYRTAVAAATTLALLDPSTTRGPHPQANG